MDRLFVCVSECECVRLSVEGETVIGNHLDGRNETPHQSNRVR